jgi:hypothetical protein
VKTGIIKISITEATYLLSVRLAAYRWHELYLGLFTELGNLHIDARLQKKLPPKDSPAVKREMHNRNDLEAKYQSNVQGQTKP